MGQRIKLQVPTFGKEDIDNINEVLSSNNVTMGSKTKSFQLRWNEWLGSAHSTFVNSGSSANLLMIQLLLSKRGKYQLKKGDEILVPAVTWSTTIFPIIQLGLKPVLVDINESSFNIDLESCKNAISKKTKALFIVHLLGNPANMDEIVNFCQDNDLHLLEDCCEAAGAKWDNKKVGTFGLVGSFSFMFAHHISTIEGGMISCKYELDDSIIKSSRAHGWIREIDENTKANIISENDIDPKHLFWDLGFNVRPTEIAAAIGINQLKKLDNYNFVRERNYNHYFLNLKSLSDKIQLQLLEDNGRSYRANFAFGFFIKDINKHSRDRLIDYLEKKNIESRPLLAGNLARQPFYSIYCEHPRVELVNSDKIHYGGIYLPNHQSLTEDQVDYISDCLETFLKD